jgi:hypothetical protein
MRDTSKNIARAAVVRGVLSAWAWGVLNQLQGLISALFRADYVATRRNRTTITLHCALSAQKMAQNHCHSAN